MHAKTYKIKNSLNLDTKNGITVIVLKFPTLFLFPFSNIILVIRAEIHKMLVRIANKVDPDQTDPSEAV